VIQRERAKDRKKIADLEAKLAKAEAKIRQLSGATKKKPKFK
jgi:hypothetical protein